jgi:hypothetical protein
MTGLSLVAGGGGEALGAFCMLAPHTDLDGRRDRRRS